MKADIAILPKQRKPNPFQFTGETVTGIWKAAQRFAVYLLSPAGECWDDSYGSDFGTAIHQGEASAAELPLWFSLAASSYLEYQRNFDQQPSEILKEIRLLSWSYRSGTLVLHVQLRTLEATEEVELAVWNSTT